MKRFLFTCAGLVLVCSVVLFLGFHYSFRVITYHLIVMTSLIGCFALILFLLAGIRTKTLRNFAITVSAAIGLSLLLLFYTFVLGSNHFWHKTITLSILKNYATSISDILSIVPVQSGIIASCLLLYLLSTVVLFLFVRPKPEKMSESFNSITKRNWQNKRWAIVATTVLLLTLFYKPLMQFKRVMHMAEEPFLEFTLGAMWGNNNDIAFDKLRYENGLRDKACTDSICFNTSEHTSIIILVDGLRADHLPMYGYTRSTAPFLDSLYRAGSLLAVRNAFSTSTNTIGGIAGLFFSKDWMEFGFNGLSLMKFFKKSGFKTYAFLTGFHRDWYGLSALYRESCDEYYESSDNPDIKSDDDLVTLKRINASVIQRKSFVFVHLLSVHMIGKKHNEFKRFFPDKISLNTDRRTALINNYDNGIVQSDFVIRNLFEKLKRDQLLNNATVYILADHGELFGENGAWGHGDNVNENLLTVPLLIYDTQQNWYANLSAATLKDVAPSLADRSGATVPFCWEGRSLHQSSANFSVEVHSVEECSLPLGRLSKKDSTIKLEIMNVHKEVERTVVKKGYGWQPAK